MLHTHILQRLGDVHTTTLCLRIGLMSGGWAAVLCWSWLICSYSLAQSTAGLMNGSLECICLHPLKYKHKIHTYMHWSTRSLLHFAGRNKKRTDAQRLLVNAAPRFNRDCTGDIIWVCFLRLMLYNSCTFFNTSCQLSAHFLCHLWNNRDPVQTWH